MSAFEFDIFRHEILQSYGAKKDHGALPNKLESPSPANLRDHAKSLASKGLEKSDLILFEEFFDSSHELEKAITKVDIGKLKPIQNFLIGKTQNPDEIIVKISAILIGFQPRPYHVWKDTQNSPSLIATQEDKVHNKDIQPLQNESVFENPHPRTIYDRIKSIKKKYVGLSIGGISVLLMGIVGAQHLKQSECAYWDGTRYVQVNCDQQKPNLEVTSAIKNDYTKFEKIMQADTLTEEDAGRVWYSKIKGKVEFFTSPGYHPFEKGKPLKPATWYMIQKYKNQNPIE